MNEWNEGVQATVRIRKYSLCSEWKMRVKGGGAKETAGSKGADDERVNERINGIRDEGVQGTVRIRRLGFPCNISEAGMCVGNESEE